MQRNTPTRQNSQTQQAAAVPDRCASQWMHVNTRICAALIWCIALISAHANTQPTQALKDHRQPYYVAPSKWPCVEH